MTGAASAGDLQRAASAPPVRDLAASELQQCGLCVYEGRGIIGELVYERPAFVFDPRRIINCRLGAFSYVNGLYTSSLYECDLGRYCSIAEAATIGAPEHPTDQFTTHPFAFARRTRLPHFYQLPEFTALAPDEDAPETFHSAARTQIGHDVWVGAGAFIKRGVSIGNGAIVAARALVTRDVPPYAIVVGAPARVHKLRTSEKLIERLQGLQWWRYDLAAHKRALDFRKLEETTSRLEDLLAGDALNLLQPEAFRLTRGGGRYFLETLPSPLYS